MSSTWVVGDIHGCAEELALLLERISPGPQDRLISVGDLYHRGPDPLGVLELLSGLSRFDLVLGNHERVLLRRAGAAGERADGSDAPALPAGLGHLPLDAMSGDGGTPLRGVSPEKAGDLLRFLEGRPYFLEGRIPGQAWVVVHAGMVPGHPPSRTHPDHLVRLRRMRRMRGRPFWYEVHSGPELVLFGHTPAPIPRTRFSGGRMVALGLDTGCVYGGSLTAFRLEDGEFASVPARRAWVEAGFP